MRSAEGVSVLRSMRVLERISSPNLQVRARISRLADPQAYMLAVADVFYASALIFLALIPGVFLMRNIQLKGGKAGADASAGAH